MGKSSGKSKETQLIKNTLLYTVSNFGSKILTFLIVPLYTYYLTTSEYGSYDTIVSIVNLIAPICILAINEGLLRWLLKSDEEEKTVFSTGIIIYVGFIIITNVILTIVFRIYNWEYTWQFIALLSAETLQLVLQFSARGMKKNQVFAVSGVLYTIVMLALNVVLVMVFRKGITGMLASMTMAYVISSLYLLWGMREFLHVSNIRFDKSLAKSMLAYSVLLVPNCISWWVMNTSDRLMLTFMIGSSFTGIYSIACKFPTIVTVIHTLFYQAWQEQAVIEYDSKNRDSYYTKVFNVYMKLAFCAVFMLIPFSKLVIVYVMDASYLSAYKYIGVLYLGSLFSSFSGFYGTGYISAKDTKNAMSTTVVGAIINIVINLAFIKTIGIWAACISTLAAYVVVWIIRVIQTKKYFHIAVEWKKFMSLLGINIIASGAICFSSNMITIMMFIISMIVTLLVNRSLIGKILNGISGKIKR